MQPRGVVRNRRERQHRAPLSPGSSGEHQDPAGQALVHPLLVLLQDGKVAGCDIGDIAVRDDDRAPPGPEDAPDLRERAVVEPVHALRADPNRLAVGEIRHDRVEDMVADRDRCGIGNHHLRPREVLPVAGDHRGVEVASEDPDPDLPCLKEDPAGAAERIEDQFPGSHQREVHECPGHPGHHHAGVEERPAHGVPGIEPAPVDPRENAAEVAAVLRRDGTVLFDGLAERYRTRDQAPDQPFQVELRGLHPASLDLLHPARKRLFGRDGKVAEEVRKRLLRGLALPEVLHHHVRQGKTPGGLRVRALGNGNLGPPVKHGAHALQFRDREVGVLAGEFEEQFHPQDVGPGGR